LGLGWDATSVFVVQNLAICIIPTINMNLSNRQNKFEPWVIDLFCLVESIIITYQDESKKVSALSEKWLGCYWGSCCRKLS
jgi:hypothetical protein